MPKQIPPTRSNYLRIEKSLDHARRGYDLLERKRQILVMELMDKMEAARGIQEEVREAMAEAFASLKKAARAAGSERLLRETCGIGGGYSVRIRTHSVMGVRVPEVNFESEVKEFPFGLLGGGSGADEVRRQFQEALELIARLAEVENAVLRLAHEVKRTQRRVNALENTFIPDYEETLDYIGESLEERDREELVIMKKVKQMQQRDKEVASRKGAEESRYG
jgi:V/A-type H+-transporting ATPase subunit D